MVSHDLLLVVGAAEDLGRVNEVYKRAATRQSVLPEEPIETEYRCEYQQVNAETPQVGCALLAILELLFLGQGQELISPLGRPFYPLPQVGHIADEPMGHRRRVVYWEVAQWISIKMHAVGDRS